MMKWLNWKRLRDYPRLVGFSIWSVLAVNIITRQGWFGGFGGIIGWDFLTLYSAGLIYWRDIQNLYNQQVQAQIEQMVFAPTPMNGGVNIFSSPPYVAFAYSVFTHLPYSWAFLLNTSLSLVAIFLAIMGIKRYLLHDQLKLAGLDTFQLHVLVLSFFPMIWGLFLGQNNALTLFLVTWILIFSLKRRDALAGLLAGMLIYKPHFVIGFLIVWVVWRRWKSLAVFGLTAGMWGISVLLTYGIAPYLDYLRIIPSLMQLTYGISRYAEVTLFALAATSLPQTALPVLSNLSQIVLFLSCVGLVWLAVKAKSGSIHQQSMIYGLAILFPFLTAPHTLHYDLVLLIPVLMLWSQQYLSKEILYWAVGTYLCFAVLALTKLTGIALLALLPLSLTTRLVVHVIVELRL